MDALVTLLAETLATAYVRLVGYRVWAWTFASVGVRVTIERVNVDETPAPLYEESMLGVPV